MVRNLGGGNRAKKQANKRSTGGGGGVQKGTRFAKDEAEVYATVISPFGNNMCKVICIDGVERLCVIRGKFRGKGKRNNLINRGVCVLVGLYEWSSANTTKSKLPKCDLLEVYSDGDKERLQQRGGDWNWDTIKNPDVVHTKSLGEDIEFTYTVDYSQPDSRDAQSNVIIASGNDIDPDDI